MAKRIVLAAVVVAVVVVAFVAYSFLRPTEQASAPIEAIPLALDATATSAPAAEAEPTEAEATPTEEVVAEATEEPEASATAEMAEPTETTEAATEAASPTAEAATETAAPTEAAPTIFEIVQESSQVRFVIDEVLRGSPFTVVGASNQVAGQIAVDPANPSATQVGTIQANARTFATDSSQRDRAIQNQVLSTNEYEFITFTPTAVVGLPETVAPGESFSFQIVGNLTIKDQTREVTWDATVTPNSEAEIAGNATTTIAYADWGVSIPSVPFVASVADTVRLELDFVAVAAS